MKDHEMTHDEWKLFNYQKKLDRAYEQNRHHCKCGHSVAIRPKEDRVMCTYCGNWIYRTEEIEKKYKLKEFERKLNKWRKIAEEKEKDVNRIEGRKLGI